VVFLAATVFVVGILTGLTGVGGILVIPALEAFAGLSVQTSMATAMCSFVFVGAAASWLQQRRRAIDWAPTLPLALAAAVGGYAGARANALVPTLVLNLGLSVVILFAGASVLHPIRGGRSFRYDRRSRRHMGFMAGIGAGVGFLSGLTGVGGPVLSIPAMVAMGFSPLAAIAAAQVLQVAVSGLGSLGYILYGAIDFMVAGWISVIQLAGLCIGIRLAHALPAQGLRVLVSVVCLLVGGFLSLRSLAACWAFG
jgi:hypothetical protein